MNLAELLEKENCKYIEHTNLESKLNVEEHDDNVKSMYKFIGNKKFLVKHPSQDIKTLELHATVFLDVKDNDILRRDYDGHEDEIVFNSHDNWVLFMQIYDPTDKLFVQYFLNCTKTSNDYGFVCRHDLDESVVMNVTAAKEKVIKDLLYCLFMLKPL